MDKKEIKKLAQSGVFKPFLEIVQGIADEYKDVEFDSDPHKVAYNLGKRDMIMGLPQELDETIKQIAND